MYDGTLRRVLSQSRSTMACTILPQPRCPSDGVPLSRDCLSHDVLLPLQRPIFDITFAYLLWKIGAAEVDATDLLPEGGRVPAADHEARVALMLRVREHARARGLTGEDKDGLLRLLADRVGADYGAITRSGYCTS